jgi:FtsH-binding integral membrane protein
MVNPNFGTFNRAGTVADQASFDVGLRAHMVRVYNYMASGLALSGIVAFGSVQLRRARRTCSSRWAARQVAQSFRSA